MDIAIIYLPRGVNQWTVTRSIASVLHSNEFAPRRPEEGVVDRPINFRFELNPTRAGAGTLTLPTAEIGNKFLKWVENTPIRIEGKKVKFFFCGTPPTKISRTLDKTPYINPDLEEKHNKKLQALQDIGRLWVDAVQFGIFYQPKYPSSIREPLRPRAFSIEWEGNYESQWLTFDYDRQRIQITLSNERTEKTEYRVLITFSSIQKIGVGYEGKPYICFDILSPPILEREQCYRALTGDDKVDTRKFRQRIGALHPGHKAVAPYSPHLRIVLCEHSHSTSDSRDGIDKFVAMCEIAGLATETTIQRCQGTTQIEAYHQNFFTPKRLNQICTILADLPWAIAFQIEALLHNHLLHTEEVLDLVGCIRSLYRRRSDTFLGDLLRTFNEALRIRTACEAPFACFQRILRKFEFLNSTQSDENFRCYHATFTPTRVILEGPYTTSSNRIIRHFRGFEDHFIRVDFRDEDRLRFRWEREVDGASFVQRRVGGILKEGFPLAGRQFEFLAYSTSALREHTAWFINPFRHPEKGWVVSQSIRDSIGNFSGTKLLKQPSKYAARLAQAFTATVSSVKIQRKQWEQVPDLESGAYLFTDGVGTISQALGDRIWAALCSKRHDEGKNSVKPSAYQIRFLGFKGVVGVDQHLDHHPGGILMRLRGSMNKFESNQVSEAVIEIAQAFERSNVCYLNRPLIMVLEDLGVRKEVFMQLQREAIADARTIDDSGEQFCSVLRAHSLGWPYHIPDLIKKIEGLGLSLKPVNKLPSYDTPFFQNVRRVTMTDILRDIKYSAHIPIPNSYYLVGVADEGPAYINAGYSDVYVLPENHIFACIQDSLDSEPIWLEGACSISRSPVTHPGDIQRVLAIGKPPEGLMCLFAHMKNCVVLPSVGYRPLASCLAGGDLDGDCFCVIRHGPLLPPECAKPASYESAKVLTIARDSTAEDICNFVVNFINSDVLGLLSDRLLVIADQSKEGIFDGECKKLAKLCSQAVDFPKQGIPVHIGNDQLPRALIRCKPDWSEAEVVSHGMGCYESNRALGCLYRSVNFCDAQPISTDETSSTAVLADPISLCLKKRIKRHLQEYTDPDGKSLEIARLFETYVTELRYICATHTLSNAPGNRLTESEIVVGTILAKCPQKRLRKDKKERMQRHASTLVKDIQRKLFQISQKAPRKEPLLIVLEKAWQAWDLSLRKKNIFGGCSFGFIALGVIFDCLDKLTLLSF
ncbi:RNA dependent RNA polymerase-domain-containing protein [Collybia nuda]|uniref:RNA-dependent RNA polymerase n=1 Tax=Collybia nuda TaxID=64659 RepID=A0A9P5Y7R2_9AGAR|nr:RNA dependent RNA polymerase-domain-containing protein [Collybia nuda]